MNAASNTQQHRAAYMVAALQQLSPQQDAAARAAAGSNDVKLKKRLIDCLTSSAALVSPAKRGPSSKFTPAILDAAREYIIDPGDKLWTGPSLVEQLQVDGQLTGAVDVDNFMRHLRERCKEMGEKLITNYTGSVFAIPRASMPTRLKWSKEVEEDLKAHPLEDWVFEDETLIEENPHPKGMWVGTAWGVWQQHARGGGSKLLQSPSWLQAASCTAITLLMHQSPNAAQCYHNAETNMLLLLPYSTGRAEDPWSPGCGWQDTQAGAACHLKQRQQGPPACGCFPQAGLQALGGANQRHARCWG